MGFLSLVNKQVVLSPEAEEFPEIVRLRNSDKTKGKKFFNSCLVYIYHTYSFDHVMNNMLPMERRRRVCETYLNGESYEKYEKNQRVRAVIELFMDDEYSINERFYQGIKNDMEQLMNHLNNIPWERKMMIEKPLVVKHPETNDDIEVTIKDEIIVDNSAEKMAALDKAKKLMGIMSELEKSIKEERKGKNRKEKPMSLLDRRKRNLV